MLTIRQYNLSPTHSHSNMVYNLSLTDLSEQARLSWYSPDDDVKMCLVKGKDEEACQNYIRILVSPAPGRLQICGTNSFRPMCRQYQVGEQNYTMVSEKNGQVVCPYDPRHNSTAVFVGTYSRFMFIRTQWEGQAKYSVVVVVGKEGPAAAGGHLRGHWSTNKLYGFNGRKGHLSKRFSFPIFFGYIRFIAIFYFAIKINSMVERSSFLLFRLSSVSSNRMVSYRAACVFLKCYCCYMLI